MFQTRLGSTLSLNTEKLAVTGPVLPQRERRYAGQHRTRRALAALCWQLGIWGLGAVAVAGCSANAPDNPANNLPVTGATTANGGASTAPLSSEPVPPAASSAAPAPSSSSPLVTEEEPVFVEEPEMNTPGGGFLPTEKVDILFVVDNSNSMADKQAIFKEAIPDMIRQMANPPCVIKDENMKQVIVGDSVGGVCSEGSAIFKPVTDIHLGVISSSLGTRGLQESEMDAFFNCKDVPEENDRAWMLGKARQELNAESYQGFGFLVWDQQQKATPPGDNNLDVLIQKFVNQIDAVGEKGCGYEAPLEAAYRFLIEPDPYETVVRVNCEGRTEGNLCAQPEGVDTDLLAQRAAFLRPDSVVVVMFLTDENDCSLKTRGQGYLTMVNGELKNGTSACNADPNSECCAPCGKALPASCEADPALNGCEGTVADLGEAKPVRCHEQERRFGLSFLRNTQVYVGGFVFSSIADRMNNAQPNPLFTDKRNRQKIFVVGILGVPWQDTATAETVVANEAGQLDLIEASEIDWSRFLPTNGAPPADPFNVETVAPRTGTHPVTGEPLGGVGTWNSINGHDRALAVNDTFDDDLQYSCIFPLPQPRDCTTETGYCDCAPATQEGELGPDGNPLCFDTATQTYGTTQIYAKAYPSPRMLEVLRGVSCPPDPVTMLPTECTDQSVLASICPRQASDPSKLDYGYRPVIRALLLNVATQIVR